MISMLKSGKIIVLSKIFNSCHLVNTYSWGQSSPMWQIA